MAQLRQLIVCAAFLIASNAYGKVLGEEQAGGSGSTGGSGGSGGKINADRDEQASSRTCKPASGVTRQQIDAWVQKHRASAAGKGNFRYAYIPLDMLQDENTANLARVGLFKGLNHTAITAPKIYTGIDISDDTGVVFAIDINQLWGADQAERKWGIIANPDTARRFSFQNFQNLVAGESIADPNGPVAADKLVYLALSSRVYADLVDGPASDSEFRQRYGFPSGGNYKAISAVKEAIVYGPRIMLLYENKNRVKYWISADEYRFGAGFGAAEGSPIPYSPDRLPNPGPLPRLDVYDTQAYEAWMEMPNGFPAYYVWGNTLGERGFASLGVVFDPNNEKTEMLLNGRGCVVCHMSGPQFATSDLAGSNSKWTPNEELSKYYLESREKFQAAMRTIIQVTCNAPKVWIEDVVTAGNMREPVNVLLQHFEGSGDGTVKQIFDKDSAQGGGSTNASGAALTRPVGH